MKGKKKVYVAIRECKKCGAINGIPAPFTYDNGKPIPRHIGQRLRRTKPLGMKWKCQKCGNWEGMTNMATRLGEKRDDIIIYPGDGTCIILTPTSWQHKPNKWRFIMDSETMTYHTTPELISDRLIPEGVKPEWERGEYLQSLSQ